MSRSLFDKIWDFHCVGQRSDGRALLYIDRHVLHELHAHHAFAQLAREGRAVHRPGLTFAVQDHTVATKPGRDDATNPSGTAFIQAMREGCTVCHNPHGSINLKLLVVDDPNLCLRCHSQVQAPNSPGSIYIGNTDHTPYLKVGTCWTAGCHTAVHGSNVDPRLRY